MKKTYNNDKFIDVDYDDFLELTELGISITEIAKELGLHEDHIKKIINDIKKNC